MTANHDDQMVAEPEIQPAPPPFSDDYQVTSDGDVYSTKPTRKRRKMRLFEGTKVQLTVCGEKFNVPVPKLIYQAFNGPVPMGHALFLKDPNAPRPCALANIECLGPLEARRRRSEVRRKG